MIAPHEVQRAGSILDRVIATMQEAEEIGGPDNVREYVAVMRAIAREATRRADAAEATL